jgi:hypothetical protein
MDHFEGNNIGSLLKVEICLVNQINGYNPVTFTAGNNWFDIPFDNENAELSISSQDTVNGMVYRYNGSFFLHRLRQEFKEKLSPYLGKRSILRITDMNNEVYILGHPGNPVRLDNSGGTGRRFSSQNGMMYSFSSDMAFEALTA